MKEWNGQRYDTDFHPIDEWGNVLGPKDEGASKGWTDANEPWRNSPGWHAQPLSADQEAGIRATNPQAYAARQAWRSANPTNAIGAPLSRPGAPTAALPPMPSQPYALPNTTTRRVAAPSADAFAGIQARSTDRPLEVESRRRSIADTISPTSDDAQDGDAGLLAELLRLLDVGVVR